MRQGAGILEEVGSAGYLRRLRRLTSKGIPVVHQIQPSEVKRLIDSGEPLVLLDVRQPEEYCLLRAAGQHC